MCDLSSMIYWLFDFGQITRPVCAVFVRVHIQEGLNLIVGVAYLVAHGRFPTGVAFLRVRLTGVGDPFILEKPHVAVATGSL